MKQTTADETFRRVVSDLVSLWGTKKFWGNPDSVYTSLKALYFTYGRLHDPTENQRIMLESSVSQLIRRWQLIVEMELGIRRRR